MESVIRVALFLVIGGALLLANVWFVNQAFENFFHRGIVIAPFQTFGDGASGATLAYLLQARLDRVQSDLAHAQEVLTATKEISSGPPHIETQETTTSQGGKHPPPPLPLLWGSPVQFNTSLFKPVDMKIAVGGVEVGSILPWLQRVLVRRETLSFSVSYAKGKTVIAGDVHALGAGDSSLWAQTPVTDAADIADLLAHEIIRRKLAYVPDSGWVRALDGQEFRDLSDILIATAELNDRIAKGQVVQKQFAELLPGVEALTNKLPDFHELLFLAGTIAENGGADEKALRFYSRLDDLLQDANAQSVEDLSPAVRGKLIELRRTRLERQIVLFTGRYEVGSEDPARVFGSVSSEPGDLMFGAGYWNFTSGTLGPLLRKFQEADSARFSAIFGDDEIDMQEVMARNAEPGKELVHEIVNDGTVLEPWKSRFEALGREPAFQTIQLQSIHHNFLKAEAITREFGLRSHRGLTFAFNIVMSMGGLRERARQTIRQEVEESKRANGSEPKEEDRLGIMARVLASQLPAILQKPTRDLIANRFAEIASGSLNNRDDRHIGAACLSLRDF